MNYTFYDYTELFLLYSFLGWVMETAVTAVRKRRMVNRGFLTGPFCTIYGFTGVFMTMFLYELEDRLFFMFLGCMIVATVAEWLTGHLLELIGRGKWWDYSDKRWNFDGYICPQYSVLWGVLGVLAVRYVNRLALFSIHLVPAGLLHIVLWAALGLLVVDAVGSYLILHHAAHELPRLVAVNRRIGAFTNRLRLFLYNHLETRVEHAYAVGHTKCRVKRKSDVFAEGCSFYKLALLFIIGAFIGDIVETLFCRATAGVWMSRSSLVWGPFSIVWGLGNRHGDVHPVQLPRPFRQLRLRLRHPHRRRLRVHLQRVHGNRLRQDLLGYSGLPFNLGGRINLLFCFFWGIAAVVWLKKLYPLFSGWIERIPMRAGKIITWCLVAFMCVDISVSMLALARYNDRAHHREATNGIERLLDARFPDSRMKQIYPNGKAAGN